jgi:hypothetical protein
LGLPRPAQSPKFRLRIDGKAIKGFAAEDQKVRSVAIELPVGTNLVEGSKHGLFADFGTDPLKV